VSHDHDQAAPNYGRAFALGTVLNVGFVVVEVVFGLLSGSLALLADAGHNAGDVVGLLLAWGAHHLGQREPTARHTYGWRGASILAALLNALILLGAVGGIGWEAIQRLGSPAPVATTTVIWVAAAGTVVNTASALLFLRGRSEDLNIRGAFLHMAADAGVSLGVVVAGLVIRATGATWLDPAASLAIGVVILISGWDLFREALHLALGGVPRDVDLSEVRDYLSGLPGVERVHDLHVWAMSTTETALSAHLVKPDPAGDDELLAEATRSLEQRFDIDHVTIQWERDGGTCPGNSPCR
jgi:cobalt-zinc-cadmium efflux system protein